MKLTIFSRLIVGYLTIIVLVTVVSVYATLKLHQINKGTRNILYINNPILDYKEKLTDSILSQLRYKKKYILTKDALLHNQYLAAKEEFNTFFSEVLFMADTQEKRNVLGKIKLDHERFMSLIDKEIEYVRKDQVYPKKIYEEEIEKYADGILESLKELEAYSRHDIRQGMMILGQSSSSASQFIITISAIAIILVLLTSVLITRSITKPLAILMDKTTEIAKGTFECDLKIASPPEMTRLARSFNSMCAKLIVVDKMKTDFFSSMSHELRTPLTSIKEGISLLQDGTGGMITEKQQRLLAILSEESKRLIDLVNSLLELSKMEAGMMSYTLEPATLAPLIQRAVTEVIPLAEAKKIGLQTKLAEPLPPLKIDSERILQVLRNLIGNALKFTPEGGRVRVFAQANDHEVQVSVADTGPGISRENLSTIFEKFHQVHLIDSNQIKGTGLGLAIVKHIVTAHGGRVWAENGPKQGSLFSFVLPV